MESTLEKIELVRDRTGVTYKEAKDALEKAGGNVVEAIIAIEEKDQAAGCRARKAREASLGQKIKAIIEKGNVARIIVTRKEKELVNLPITAGVIGTIIAPWAAVAGLVAAIGFDCKIEFLSTNGQVFDLSEKADSTFQYVKEHGQHLYSDIREKAPEAFDDIKDKGQSAFHKAKSVAKRAGEKAENAKDALKDNIGKAAHRTGEAVEDVADKAEDVKEGLAKEADAFKDDLKESAHDFKEDAKDLAEDAARFGSGVRDVVREEGEDDTRRGFFGRKK